MQFRLVGNLKVTAVAGDCLWVTGTYHADVGDFASVEEAASDMMLLARRTWLILIALAPC